MLKFIKLYYNIIFAIMILGIVEFIGAKYNISFINSLIHIVSNIRDEQNSIIIEANSNIARIRSVFMEPGGLAKFIVINLPFIYKLLDSDFSLWGKNFYANLYKKSIVILSFVCLFLAQSPINIIIGFIVTILYFWKYIIKRKNVLFFISIPLTAIIFVLLLGDVDLSKTFLIRIIKVSEILTSFSFESFVLVEPSLAARIINYTNEFLVFLQYPIMGIGFGNSGPILIQQFLNSPVPLTIELIQKVNEGSRTFTSNTFYLLLFQTGIVGAVLYYFFAIKSLLLLKKVKLFYYGNMRLFIEALEQVIIITLVLSVLYNQGLVDILPFIHFGLCVSFMQILKNSKERMKKFSNGN